MQFSTELMEREYLQAAIPADVLRWVDQKVVSAGDLPEWNARYLPESVEAVLLSRRDRTVDMALARAGTPEAVEEVLARHSSAGWSDPDLVAAALANQSGICQFYKAPRWLTEALPWIATDGDTALFFTLMHNPRTPECVVTSAFRREGPFAGMPDDRWAVLLAAALENVRVRQPPQDTNDGPDFRGAHCIQSAWMSLLVANPQDARTGAVYAYRLAGMEPVNLPYHFDASDAPEDGGTFDIEKLHSKSSRALKVYFDAVFARWSDPIPEARKARSTHWHSTIRELVASKAPCSYPVLLPYLREHPDIAVRRGYYRMMPNATIEQLDAYFAKDGLDFVEAAVENEMFGRRDKVAESKWLLEKIRGSHTAFGNWYVPPRAAWDERLQALHRANPRQYFDTTYEIEYPGFESEKDGEQQQPKGPSELTLVRQDIANLRGALRWGWALLAFLAGMAVARM